MDTADDRPVSGGPRQGIVPTISSAYLKSAVEACFNSHCAKNAFDDLIPGGAAALDNPTMRFPANTLNEVLFRAERLTSITGMGIRFGMNIRPPTLMEIGYALISCQNLADMIAFNAKYQRLTQQIARGYLEEDGDTSYLIWEPFDDDAEYQRPVTEGSMAGYSAFGRWVLWTANLQVREIHMRHKAPDDLSTYEAALPYKLVFEADRNQVVAPTELFYEPLPGANRDLVDLFAQRLDRALALLDQPLSFRDRTFYGIQSIMREGSPTLPRVAKLLGTAERTLRRRLADEDSSFRDILEAARRDALEIYLSDEKRTWAEIAILLGYSDQSAFIRAFKSWYDVTPREYLGARKGKG